MGEQWGDDRHNPPLPAEDGCCAMCGHHETRPDPAATPVMPRAGDCSICTNCLWMSAYTGAGLATRPATWGERHRFLADPAVLDALARTVTAIRERDHPGLAATPGRLDDIAYARTDRDEDTAVAAARADHVGWPAIAAAAGRSPSAAWHRWAPTSTRRRNR